MISTLFSSSALPLFNHIFIGAINAVGLALLITTVNHGGIRKRVTQIFVGMGALMFLWVDCAYLARFVGGSDIALAETFLRIAWFATPLFFTFLYLISVYIVKKEREYSLLSKSILISGIVLSVITGFTDIIIAGITYQKTTIDIVYGKGFIPFLAIILLFMIATLVPLFHKKSSLKDFKKETHSFLFGIFIFYGLNTVFNITLPAFFGVTHLYYLGDYSTIMLLGFTSYAILRHKLLDVKVVTTELFVYALWAFMFLRLFSFETFGDRVVALVIFGFTIVIGIYLMRSVIAEVKAREEIEELARDLEKANVRLKELDQLKSEFLSIASHQMRSPLTAIKGYASLILEGTYGAVSDSVRQAVDKMFRSTESMISVVEEFLNVSRIEQGRMQYIFAKGDLKELVVAVVGELKPVVDEKGLMISFEATAADYTANIDRDKLKQVFVNLVDNAVKYTKEGRISVKMERRGDTIRTTISDTGVGMTEADIGKLFHRFSRAAGANNVNTKGTGLGLYVAKEMVTAHKGKIWAESDGKGRGSRFIVEIPAL